MIIVDDISKIPDCLPKPCGLTIGSYDGIHRGHAHLLTRLRQKIGKGTLAVFSFKNHPSHILRSRMATALICTPLDKIRLLEEQGVDLLILQTFTDDFAQMTYEAFLLALKKKLDFTELMLGVGASFGKDQKGDEIAVNSLQKELNFKAEYVEKLQVDNYIVSSGLVRNFIKLGQLENIEYCLGRPYSIRDTLQQDDRRQLFLSLHGLCLLPEGEYKVTVHLPQKTAQGKARVDRENKKLFLHIPSVCKEVIGTPVDVVF